VTNGYYVYYHIYATSNSTNAYYSVMSRYQYDTLDTAQSAGPTEVCELNQTFPLFELTPIGSVLYQTDDTYTNAVKARVVSISATEIFHDTRRIKISQQVICLKHSQIAGLEEDTHLQYSLLDGRSGDELNIDQINEFTLNEGTTFPDFIKATGGFRDANVTTTINLGSASATALNSTFTATSLVGAMNENKQTFNDMSEPSGLVNTTDQNSTFTNGTRTFEITPAVSTFSFYTQGQKWTKSSADSVVIDDTEGLHMIYYDNTGTLVKIANPTEAQIETAILAGALVGWVYWDATNNLQLYFTGDNEYHGIQMDSATHVYLHLTQGTQYVSGSALGDILVDQDGSLATHAQFSCAVGVIRDEDLTTSLSAIASTTGLPVYYKNGASGDWRRTINAGFSILTTGTGRMAWNEFTGGAWQQTEVGNNNFALTHVYSTNDSTYPYIAIMGQAEYNTVIQARSGAANEINTLILSGLPFAEFVPIASVIYQTSTGYTNAVKSRIRSTDEGDDYVDFRFSGISPSSTPASHSNLSDLDADTHDQYALLNGRSGDTLLIDNIGEFTSSAGVSFNHIPKTSIVPTAGSDLCNKTYVDNAVGGAGYWSRTGTTIEPTTTGDDMKVDVINEQTASAGVTIEGVLLNDSQIQESGLTIRNPASGNTSLYIEANTSGVANMFMKRAGGTSDTVIIYSEDSTNLWRTGAIANEDDFTIYSFSAATNAMSIGYSDSVVDIPTSLKCDTINESTAAAGVTIEGILLKDSAIQEASIDIENPAAGGTSLWLKANTTDALFYIQREATGSNSVVVHRTTSTDKWKVGMYESASSYQVYNYNLSTESMTILSDGGVKFPQVYDDNVTTAAVYINTAGQLGRDTSIAASKTNIATLTDASFIYSLTPKTFNRRKVEGKFKWSETEYHAELCHGLIAEELQPIKPELCTYISIKDHVQDCPDTGKNKDYECSCACPMINDLAGIKYVRLIAPMIKCIKDQKATIDTLLLEINDLKNRVTALEQV
jgi:hypothetical protein